MDFYIIHVFMNLIKMMGGIINQNLNYGTKDRKSLECKMV